MIQSNNLAIVTTGGQYTAYINCSGDFKATTISTFPDNKFAVNNQGYITSCKGLAVQGDISITGTINSNVLSPSCEPYFELM